MFKKSLLALATLGLLATSYGAFVKVSTNTLGKDCDKYDREGWLTVFNGDSTWSENFLWVSPKTGHGTTGGHWWVAPDPALVTAGKIKPGQNILWSMQNDGGNGGVFMTKRKYANYETKVGVFPGWENDGGLFHRVTEGGACYQMMIDYRGGGTIGGLWPEGIDAGRPSQDVYNLSSETAVRKGPVGGTNDGGSHMNWPVTDWPKIWDADGFNTMYGRIIGPTKNGKIQAFGWLGDSAHTISEFEATAYPANMIGLQIHAGAGSWKGGPNKYTFWKVRELDSTATTLAAAKPVCPAQPTVAAYNVDYITPVNKLVLCSDLASGTCTGAIQALKGTAINSDAKSAVNGLRVQWQGNMDQTLRVTGDVAGEYTIYLMNVSGQQINSARGNGNFSHDFSGLTKGVYMVNVVTKDGIQTAKTVRF